MADKLTHIPHTPAYTMEKVQALNPVKVVFAAESAEGEWCTGWSDMKTSEVCYAVKLLESAIFGRIGIDNS